MYALLYRLFCVRKHGLSTIIIFESEIYNYSGGAKTGRTLNTIMSHKYTDIDGADVNIII